MQSRRSGASFVLAITATAALVSVMLLFVVPRAEAHDIGWRVKWRVIALANLAGWCGDNNMASDYTTNSNLDVTAYSGQVYSPGLVRVITVAPSKYTGRFIGAAMPAANYEGVPHDCGRWADGSVVPGECGSAPPSPGQPDKRVEMGWLFINVDGPGYRDFSVAEPYFGQRMLTHEIGHVFGLNHPDEPDTCTADSVMSKILCFTVFTFPYELGSHDITDLGSYYP
jgi:hypothetical protein